MLRKLLQLTGLGRRFGPRHLFWRELGIACVVGGIAGGLLAWIIQMLSSPFTGFLLGAIIGIVVYLRRKFITPRVMTPKADEKK